MNLYDRFLNDLKSAIKEKNKNKISVLRMLISEINYKKSVVNIRSNIDGKGIIEIVGGYHKKLKKALKEYPAGVKKDILLQEIEIVEHYLPKQLSVSEVGNIIDEVLLESKEHDFGKLMKMLVLKIGLGADGKTISLALKDKLKGK